METTEKENEKMLDVIEGKIKTTSEAIEFLQKKANINVEEVNAKWIIWDDDIDNLLKDDEDLIDYANEQKEAIED